MATYPVAYEADHPDGGIARWRPFLHWLMVVPNAFVLVFVAIGAYLAFIFFAWWAVLFTRRYPRGAFDFITGTLRWSYRLTAYQYLMTEKYPPFSTDDDPSYPVRVRYAYPEGGIARWRPLLHWLMAIPHYIALWFVGIGVFVALVIAWFAIVFTRTYPPEIFGFIAGAQRWNARVAGYIFLTTEEYPPFSLT